MPDQIITRHIGTVTWQGTAEDLARWGQNIPALNSDAESDKFVTSPPQPGEASASSAPAPDLSNEALDALVARLLDGPSRVYRDMVAGKQAANTITALRDREQAVVAAAKGVADNPMIQWRMNALRAALRPFVGEG